MSRVQNTHDEYIYIDMDLRTSSELHFDVIVYGHSLTLEADRTVTNKDWSDMEQAIEFYKFLNLKIMEELERDPEFVWTTIDEWKRWANGFNQEFLSKQIEENAELILADQKKYMKKRLAGN